MAILKCNDILYDTETKVLTVEKTHRCITEDVAKFFGILASGYDAPAETQVEDTVNSRLARFTEASNLRKRLEQALERAKELEDLAFKSWLDLVEEMEGK